MGIAEMLGTNVEDGSMIYDDLLLVKIDATANDTPMPINVYPRIYLYKNQVWPKTAERENVVRYGLRRREDTFISWVQRQCGYAVQEENVSEEGDQSEEHYDE